MIAVLVVAAALTGGAEDIPTLFREARQAEQRRDFSGALEKYSAVLRADATIAEVWANQGLVLYELGRHREALHAFEKAVELKPQLTSAQLFLGLEYLRFGEPRKALAPLGTALKLDPANAQAGYALADAHAKLGHFEEAIALYQGVLSRQPGMEEASYALAIAYLNFSKSIARKLIDSGSGYGKLLLAEYLAIGDANEAAEANYQAALEALPESGEVLGALRAFYLRRNQPEKAEAMGAMEPDSAPDPMAPALALWREGRYQEVFQSLLPSVAQRARYWLSLTCNALAREILVESVRRNPNSVHACLLLADLAKNAGDSAAAQAGYEKAARLAPDNVEAQLLFIRFIAPRDPAAALEYAQQAADGSDNAELNVELGMLLLESDNARAAAGRFRRALDREPDLAKAHAGLADAYAKSGEFAPAISEMKHAIAADPDGSWHYRLATWYKAAGRLAEAREAFAATAQIKAQQRAKEVARFLELTSVGRQTTP